MKSIQSKKKQKKTEMCGKYFTYIVIFEHFTLLLLLKILLFLILKEIWKYICVHGYD